MLRILGQNWAIVAIGIGSMRQALSWRADLEIAEHQQQYFLLYFANSVVFALVLVPPTAVDCLSIACDPNRG